jgi:hypothetical protein
MVLNSVNSLDCSACKGLQTMGRTKINRFSTIVVAIGWLMVLPSVIGILIGLAMCGGVCHSLVGVTSATSSQAETDGATLGVGLGVVASFGVMAFSLIGGLLGYLLVSKRKVYKCQACGFILERG